MRKQFAQKWQLKSSFAGFKLFSARQIRIGSGHSLFSFVGENFIRVLDQKETNVKTSNEYHIIINIYTQPVRL